jgi:hypothetical protein
VNVHPSVRPILLLWATSLRIPENLAQIVLLPNEDALPTAGAFAESSDEIFSCRMEFITKLGPQISLSPVPIFGVNTQSSHRREAGDKRLPSWHAYTEYKPTLSQASTVAILEPNSVYSSETKGQSSSDPTFYATSTTHSKNQPRNNAQHQKTKKN